MKMFRKLSVPIVGFLLLAGCTTTVLRDEPGKSSTTLVVGRLELHAWNFRSYRSADINGTHSMGVEIHLIDIVHNNRKVLQSSGDDGLFYSTKLEPGQYKIEKFRFKRNSSNWGAVSIWFRPKENNSILIQSGSVNNLGLVKWCAKNFTTKPQSDGRGSPTGVKYVFNVDELGIFTLEDEEQDYYPLSLFLVNEEYHGTRKLFEERFKKSGWLDYRWINVPIG